jgi:hypothetical protein
MLAMRDGTRLDRSGVKRRCSVSLQQPSARACLGVDFQEEKIFEFPKQALLVAL